MHTFLFRCPLTGLRVQGRHEAPELPDHGYVAHYCPACGGMHPVNPRTGKLMSEESGGPPENAQ